MIRWTLPILFVLAACDAKPQSDPLAPTINPITEGPATGPWINSDDQSPLTDKLAGWKGRKVVLLEFSFLA